MHSPLLLQKAASEFRNSHGIGSLEPIRMRSWLPKFGVLAVFKPLSDGFSGMAVKQASLRFMIINSTHRISKQHFTIAHELYHLFIQKDFVSEISRAGLFDKKNPSEYAADCFAAYLLMPEDGILALIPQAELSGKNRLTLPTIVKLEQYFACSRTALLFRLKELGLIDYPKYSGYAVDVEQSARLLGYDASLYRPGNDGLVIGDYGERAKRLFDKEKISESHFFNLMLDLGIDISAIVKTNEQE